MNASNRCSIQRKSYANRQRLWLRYDACQRLRIRCFAPELTGCCVMEPSSPAPRLRLDDFLKCRGLVGTGGEAKVRIQSGEVRVNGEVETRRRKQLAIGDQVEAFGEMFEVAVEDFD